VTEKALTLYTTPLTPQQAKTLREILQREGWEFSEKQYTLYFAQKNKLTAAVYEKGPKLVLQGKGTQEFVQFTLEPEVLGEAKLGYEEVHNPEMFSPHFGIDESGKGDFFGPMVIAGVYTDASIVKRLADAGIQDSKRIGSDKRIRDLAKIIKNTPGAAHTVVMIGPESYNRMMARNGNVNRVLAWGHARAIENLLEARPECPRSLSDQFGNPQLIKRALLEKGRAIELQQRTKAESDIAVAAASILARERFIDWMDATGRTYGCKIPRGASAEVKEVAKKIIAAHEPLILEKLAKTHFKTAAEVAPGFFHVKTNAALPGDEERE